MKLRAVYSKTRSDDKTTQYNSFRVFPTAGDIAILDHKFYSYRQTTAIGFL